MSEPDDAPAPNEPVSPPGSQAAELVDRMDLVPAQVQEDQAADGPDGTGRGDGAAAEAADAASGSGGRVEPPD